MDKSRKYIFLVSVISLVVLSGFILWPFTHVSVPDDIKSKLGQELIERIQNGTLATTHDCIVVCSSTEDTHTVVDTLPSESVLDVWELLGGFHALLRPAHIFNIARMDEVIRIDYNGIVTVA